MSPSILLFITLLGGPIEPPQALPPITRGKLVAVDRAERFVIESNGHRYTIKPRSVYLYVDRPWFGVRLRRPNPKLHVELWDKNDVAFSPRWITRVQAKHLLANGDMGKTIPITIGPSGDVSLGTAK